MIYDGTLIQHPVKIEVLYSSENIVVALVEGVLYVRDEEHFMHPVTLCRFPDGSVEYMDFDNIRAMTAQEKYEVFPDWVKITHKLPDQQFDEALDREIPCLPDDGNGCRGKEYCDILDILYDVFEADLDKAQTEAKANLLLENISHFHEESYRFTELGRDGFIEWFLDHFDGIDLEKLETLIYDEFGDTDNNEADLD